MISLDEMKNYLRVDFEDDDALLEELIVSSERLCMDITRIKSKDVFEKKENARIAVMYQKYNLLEAVIYLPKVVDK